jgi:hypothetical protein
MGPNQGFPKSFGQRQYFGHVIAKELATEIDHLAQAVGSGFHPAADAVAGLKQQEVYSCHFQFMRRGEGAKSGPDDDNFSMSGRTAQ